MLFHSFSYLVFLPSVVLVYWLLPHAMRRWLLLGANLIFYAAASPRYLLLLAVSVLAAWGGAIALEHANSLTDPKARTPRKKRILIALLILVVGILFLFKYTAFAVGNLNGLAELLGLGRPVSVPHLLLPVGLSFYTMTVVGYLVDVYRGSLRAERNLVVLALFVSFFPQLLAGPIAKGRRMLPQYHEPRTFEPERFREGVWIIVLGLLKKVVIADRLAMLSDAIFDKPGAYPGITVLLGMFAYSLQLYCDFSAYSEIALGSAKLLGIDLIRNFEKPILSTSTASFYRKWHVSLTNWLNEYVYMPLSRRKTDKPTLYRNILIVWLVSGLWHGPNWTFIVWGLLNGLFNLVGKETRSFRTRFHTRIGLQPDSRLLAVGAGLTTFFLISFSRVFFRASHIGDAFAMLRSFFIPFSRAEIQEFIPSSFGFLEFALAAGLVVLMLTVEALSEKLALWSRFLKTSDAVRGAALITAVLFILIFGAYGKEYTSVNFLYFRF